MAPDTKRITGPESSTPYRFYSELNKRTFEQLMDEALNKHGFRKDGRRLDEARGIFGYLNAVTRAKGSAFVEMGKTKVIVTVYEPREMPKQAVYDGQGELYCEVKFGPFSTAKRSQLQPGSEEREMAAAVKRALEPAVLRQNFANFQVDIFAYILENDGSCLATVINAASLALADAEIPMFDTLIALTVGIQGDKIFVDPTADEESLCLMSKTEDNAGGNHGVLVKAIMPENQQVTELWQHGAITLETVLSVVEMYEPVYQDLYSEMRALLMEKCEQYLEQKKIKDAKKTHYEREIENLIDVMSVDA